MSTATPMPVDVTLTIGLDTEIGRVDYQQINEDGDHDGGKPFTVLDAIIQSASRQLVERVVKDIEPWGGLKRALIELSQTVAAARVEARIEEVINNYFKPTNEFGEQVGEWTSLREQIAKEIQRQLTRTHRGDGATAFDGAVKHVVADLVAKELKADIDAAKAQLREELAASAGQAAAKMLGVG